MAGIIIGPVMVVCGSASLAVGGVVGGILAALAYVTRTQHIVCPLTIAASGAMAWQLLVRREPITSAPRHLLDACGRLSDYAAVACIAAAVSNLAFYALVPLGNRVCSLLDRQRAFE